MGETEFVAGSFRDPSGFLYLRDGVLHRQINPVYREHYDLLMGSGLYERLLEEQLLVPHEEVAGAAAASGEAYKVIRPQPVPFVSYPYEWCFSQLKAAALTTLRIQQIALEHGQILKDASAYNVQFVGGRPVFIDTLSFEPYVEGRPWVAYRQFCQHFLATLALIRYGDPRLSRLQRMFLDGIPLDLCARLLPWRSSLRLPLLLHLHLQARAERRLGDAKARTRSARVSKQGLLGILASLESGVRGLDWQPREGQWGDYYERTNYSARAWEGKCALVERFIDLAVPEVVWDLGANTGVFSRIAARKARLTVALDADPVAVEKSYRQCVAENEMGILPLVVDLTNPSPGLGWENQERTSLSNRGRPETLLALALVHHLAIGNNLPLRRIARSLAGMCRSLIIEFVPKSDSQVHEMLATREDVFPEYTRTGFEEAFAEHFLIAESRPIPETERRLYLMTVGSG